MRHAPSLNERSAKRLVERSRDRDTCLPCFYVHRNGQADFQRPVRIKAGPIFADFEGTIVFVGGCRNAEEIRAVGPAYAHQQTQIAFFHSEEGTK